MAGGFDKIDGLVLEVSSLRAQTGRRSRAVPELELGMKGPSEPGFSCTQLGEDQNCTFGKRGSETLLDHAIVSLAKLCGGQEAIVFT
eukprot:2192561-Rhodomonas_salina.2